MTNRVLSIIKSDLPEKWQQILSDLITDPKELSQILELDPGDHRVSDVAINQFPLKVPRSFVGQIVKGNWEDPYYGRSGHPLLKKNTAEYVSDPLMEKQYNPIPGLLHKYRGRVLLTTAPHCAVHCRYCFRRHFDYHKSTPSRSEWLTVLNYIQEDPEYRGSYI